MKLSNQALGAIMMALQKAILEETDVTEVLRGFELECDDLNELIINNPPTIKYDFNTEELCD
tara:strand:+ start:96 stop:281 length:186 start_codon:yes stop_codon:yes gene_type:complete